MTLSNSMILVDQTAVPLATPDAIRDLGGCWPADLTSPCREGRRCRGGRPV